MNGLKPGHTCIRSVKNKFHFNTNSKKEPDLQFLTNAINKL